ncbi:MAG: GNAT family N-acetyltransferase [Gilvibacter sp.]
MTRPADAVSMKIRPLTKADYPAVAQIYTDGLATGVASFETKIPTWSEWDSKFLPVCRFVATIDEVVIGWCALSAVSKRDVYRGVAEDTIYLSAQHRGKGWGKTLLNHLIKASEAAGFWTLQAGIFPQNKASILLHENCGFRRVGIRKQIAQRDGIWHDNILLERRTNQFQSMKNILVLCTGNSCRSQMAHGYLKQILKGKAAIYSAGIETHGLNPGAVATMALDGVDLSTHTSNHVDEYKNIDWDFIITVCDHAHENCPFIAAPNAKRLHHNFYDPSKFEGSESDKKVEFAKARDQIKAYCEEFGARYF